MPCKETVITIFVLGIVVTRVGWLPSWLEMADY